MYNGFLRYNADEKLFSHDDNILVGVSGGIDSVVLAHLFNHNETRFAIAHCNFNLRGNESDEDENFVKNLSEDFGVQLYTVSFQTSEYASEKGISIEMAARELRYDWFEKIANEHGFTKIAVAHHLDDTLETFILNLSRGTGIRGLSGIKPAVGKIIRPLLFATRKEIELYASENNLDFRFDSSNDDIHFRRNKVRHKILPLIEELNPAFRENLCQTIQNLAATEKIYTEKINEVKKLVVHEEGCWTIIDKEELQNFKPTPVYLFEILRTFGFNPSTISKVSESINASPGSQFFSSSHRLVIDRKSLIVMPIEKQNQELFYIERDQDFVFDPIEMKITVETHLPGYKIAPDKHIGLFDLDKINFPLVIRKWQHGEYFRPLGMGNLKKVSDFFIDKKLSIPEKENTWIIASDNKIIWIVGHRIDDRFKVTKDTSQILRMELQL